MENTLIRRAVKRMNELANKLNWIGCSKHYSKRGNDVTITIAKNKDKNAISITMRNDIFKLLGDEVDYIEVAVYKNRVFFRQSDDKNGILLKSNKNATQTTRYAKINIDRDVAYLVPFAGDYEMKHDDFYDLYYIENKGLNTND